MTQTQQFEADVLGVEPEAPETFNFQGKDYVMQRTPIVDKLGMEDAGFGLSFDFSMEVRNSQFVAPVRAPANADIIVVRDVEYCIVATSPDQLGIVTHYAVKQKS